MSDTVIIGIDPSLTGLAVAVRAPDGSIEVERFTSKPLGKSVTARLARYAGLIERATERAMILALEHRTGEVLNATVYMEGYSYNSKGSVIATAEFGGLLRRTLVDEFGSVTEVAPATLKQFVCKGKASKTMVIGEIVKRYGVTFATDDEYDAYALARLGAVVEGLDRPANGKQAAAAEKVRKSRET